MATKTVYLRTADGATHALAGKRLAKLSREFAAGRGGEEITALVEAGYVGFLGSDGEVWDLENLPAECTK